MKQTLQLFWILVMCAHSALAQIIVEEKMQIEEAKKPTEDETRNFWSDKIRFIGNEKQGGFTNPDGSIRIPVIYEGLERSLNSFMIAKLNGKVGVIDNYNKVLIPFGTYGVIERLETFSIDRDPITWEETAKDQANIGLLVVKDGKYGLVNPMGDVLIPLEHSGMLHLGKKTYAVRKGTKWHIVNNRNQRINPQEFDRVYSLYGDMARLIIGTKEGLLKVPDTLLLPIEYDQIKSGSWPYLDAQKDSVVYQYHTYDRELTRSTKKAEKLMYESEFGRNPSCAEFLRISKSGAPAYGVKSRTKGVIVPPIYEFTMQNANCSCFIAVAGKRGIFDTNGTIIVPFDYDFLYPSPTNPDVFQAGNGKEYYFINMQGERITDDVYATLHDLYNGFYTATHKEKGLVAIINSKGKRISEFNYNSAIKGVKKDTVQASESGRLVCFDEHGIIPCTE